MKNIFTIFICALTLSASSQQWNWAIKTEKLEGILTALGPDGSTYVTGWFQDSCEIDGQVFHGAATPNATTVLFKLDGNGAMQWYQPLNGPGSIFAIQTDGNDLYVFGNVRGAMTGLLNDSSPDPDVFYARFSPAGNQLFYKRDGGPGGQELSGCWVQNGDVYLTGTFFDTAAFSGYALAAPSNYYSTFYTKYTSGGSPVFVKSMIGTYNVMGFWPRVNSTGDLFLVGLLVDTVHFGNGDTTIFFNDPSFYTKVIQVDNCGKVVRILSGLSNYFSGVRNLFMHGATTDPYLIYMGAGSGGNHSCGLVWFEKKDLADSSYWSHLYGGSYDYSNPSW